MYKIGGNIGY